MSYMAYNRVRMSDDILIMEIELTPADEMFMCKDGL